MRRLSLLVLVRAAVAGTLAIGVCTAQQQGTNAPVIPQSGELHIPPNTRVIEGTVKDAHGTPISGAIVLLKDTKTLQIRSYIAQSDGTYKFFGLSTDVNYQVRAQAKGLTSSDKLISVFDSHKFIKVDLTIKDKKKNAKS